jgi:hypothetical protein
MRKKNPALVQTEDIAVSIQIKGTSARLYMWNTQTKKLLGFGEIKFVPRCIGINKQGVFPTLELVVAESERDRGSRYGWGPLLWMFLIIYASDPLKYKHDITYPYTGKFKALFASEANPNKLYGNFGLIPDREAVSADAARLCNRLLADSTYRDSESALIATSLAKYDYSYLEHKDKKSSLNYGYKAKDHSISIEGTEVYLRGALQVGRDHLDAAWRTEKQGMESLKRQGNKLWSEKYSFPNTIGYHNYGITHVEKK